MSDFPVDVVGLSVWTESTPPRRGVFSDGLQVLTAKDLGDDYGLALVEVSPEGPDADQIRYLTRPFGFDGTGTNDFRVTKLVLNWKNTWAQGGLAR